jgi:hypothetical protein
MTDFVVSMEILVPVKCFRVVPYLKLIVARFGLWRPRFNPREGHVGFVKDKVALSRFFPSTPISSANSHTTNCSKFINHPSI